MKKIKVLISLLVVLSMTIGFTLSLRSDHNVLSDTKSSVNGDLITNKLSDTLKTWVIKNEAEYYKDITIAMTPAKVEIKDGKVEGTFNVTVGETLKATTPEELPAIKGMVRFRDLESKKLSFNKISAVNKEIDDWVTLLKIDYIGKTESINFDFRVVADISANGSIQPETAHFFVADAEGNFDEIYSLVQSADEMEMEGFNDAKEIADNAKDIIPNSLGQDIYQWRVARDYANSWSSNPPDSEGNDQYEYVGNGEYSWWDTTHWKVGWPTNPHDPDNPGEFIFSLNSAFYDNDCADYVSQALYKGGVPMDNTWYCTRYSYNPPSYTWGYVPALKSYMVSHGYFQASSYALVYPGDVIIHPNNHTMMVVANDTISGHELSAHTRDRQNYGFTNTLKYYAECEYYAVHVWE